MQHPIRLLIVDDHELFRQGLKSVLQFQPHVSVVGEVARASDLGSQLAATPCDIVLLDLQLERSVLADITTLAERAKVVVLTASERAEEALAAVRLGAQAVVLKRFALETLMEAIDAVSNGNVWLPPELQARVTAEWRQPAERLTERELEIARHVALGMRNAEVAERLRISEVTVKAHLNSIFHKIGLRDRVELALYAVRAGIITADERLS